MEVPHASDEILDIHDRYYKIYVLRTSLLYVDDEHHFL